MCWGVGVGREVSGNVGGSVLGCEGRCGEVWESVLGCGGGEGRCVGVWKM